MSFASHAQEKALPDFSGTWLYEKSTSLSSSQLYRKKETEVSSLIDRWVISQSGLEIAIHQSLRFDLIHHKTRDHVKALEMDRKWTVFADGRGDRHDTQNADSSTNWVKAKLVTVFYSKPDKKGEKEKIGKLEMELAKDGKTLIVSWKEFEELDYPILQQVFPQNRRDYYKLQ